MATEYAAETNNSAVEKFKNRVRRTLIEDEANNKQLDKVKDDTQRSNFYQ